MEDILNEEEAGGVEKNSNEEGAPKKKKRPRINRADKMAGADKIEDALEYKQNKCTQRGREIENVPCGIQNTIWFDQHYVGRDTIGEDDGTPREGIDSETIMAAVKDGFRHLLFYSATVGKFAFVNHELNGAKSRRVLIKDSYSSTPTLNVIIETHFIDFNKYETTVKTALCKDGYTPFDGDYVLDLTGEYSSTVYIYTSKRLQEISSCDT